MPSKAGASSATSHQENGFWELNEKRKGVRKRQRDREPDRDRDRNATKYIAVAVGS